MDLRLKLTNNLGEGFEAGTTVTSNMVITDDNHNIEIINEVGEHSKTPYNENYEIIDEEYRKQLVAYLQSDTVTFEVVEGTLDYEFNIKSIQ